MKVYDNGGFQDVPKVVHLAASRKGGKIKVKKGFAMNPELAKRAGSIGGRNAAYNRREGINKTKEDTGGHEFRVDELFRNPQVIDTMKRLADE